MVKTKTRLPFLIPGQGQGQGETINEYQLRNELSDTRRKILDDVRLGRLQTSVNDLASFYLETDRSKQAVPEIRVIKKKMSTIANIKNKSNHIDLLSIYIVILLLVDLTSFVKIDAILASTYTKYLLLVKVHIKTV